MGLQQAERDRRVSVVRKAIQESGEQPWAAITPPSLEELRPRYPAAIPDATLQSWLDAGTFSRQPLIPEGELLLGGRNLYGGLHFCSI